MKQSQTIAQRALAFSQSQQSQSQAQAQAHVTRPVPIKGVTAATSQQLQPQQEEVLKSDSEATIPKSPHPLWRPLPSAKGTPPSEKAAAVVVIEESAVYEEPDVGHITEEAEVAVGDTVLEPHEVHAGHTASVRASSFSWFFWRVWCD